MSERKLLGRDLFPILWILMGYRAVFEIDEGLEVDEVNMVVIERTRVYFDDVLGITFHQVPGIGFLVATGFGSVIFGTLAVSAFLDPDPIAGAILAFATLLFAAAFVLRVRIDQ